MIIELFIETRDKKKRFDVLFEVYLLIFNKQMVHRTHIFKDKKRKRKYLFELNNESRKGKKKSEMNARTFD